MTNVLFLTEDRCEGLSPATRMRVHYFLDALSTYGVRPVVSRSWISVYFYQYPAMQRLVARWPLIRYPIKAAVLPVMAAGRLADLARRSRFDVIVMQRDLIPAGISHIERLFMAGGGKVVFDFDDAIYLNYRNPTNRLSRLLWDREKIGTLLRSATAVTVGNRTLLQWAQQWNGEAHLIPTCVDIARYRCHDYGRSVSEIINLGWIGSDGNLPYLYSLYPVLDQLAADHPGLRLTIVAGSEPQRPIRMPTVFEKWSLATEAALIAGFDIGLMPVPDNEWTRGKCGGKILQYFASALPVVASPVGVNSEMIKDGINGFSATTDTEWQLSLTELIKSPSLRQSMGTAGRNMVESEYTVDRWAPVLAELLKRVGNGRMETR